jgi:S1-C subfamily serine protease
MSVNRYHFEAIYYVKQAHFVLGAHFRDLKDAERQALQSNRGAYIDAVVDGSPAFRADILVGDIIIALDQAPVYGYQGLMDAVGQRHGQNVVFSISRNGQTIKKSVQLNN